LGESLSGRPTLQDRLAHFLAVCNVVANAHSRGVVHRDIKPPRTGLEDRGNLAPGGISLQGH
jgi:serine/threonine protein kinase